MSRILTVDIGNTSIAACVFDGDTVISKDRIATRRNYPKVELRAFLRSISLQDGGCPKGSILSSVVPEINDAVLAAMEAITGKRPVLVDRDMDFGIDVSAYAGGSIGTDRLVDMTAARSIYTNRPVIVCDLGSCTTITVCDDNGVLLGGMISPGIQMSLNAEAQHTSQLPDLLAGSVTELLGRDTQSNMMSGAVAGAGLMISAAADRIEREYDLDNAALVITGGHGELILPWIERECVYRPGLLMEGLRAIYEMKTDMVSYLGA